jgi:hypothetical protein
LSRFFLSYSKALLILSSREYDPNLISDTFEQLTSVTCSVLSASVLYLSSVECEEEVVDFNQGILCTSLSLLTLQISAVTRCSLEHENREAPNRLDRFRYVLEQSHLVRSLVSLHILLDTKQLQSTNSRGGTDAIAIAIIDFFANLAATDDIAMLSLIFDYDLTPLTSQNHRLINWCAVNSVALQFPLRGYFLDENQKHMHDPRHELWTRTLSFIGEALLSCTCNDALAHVTFERVFEFAAHFLVVFDAQIFAIFQQCHAASKFGSTHMFLTCNLLKELSCVLSIISSLCHRPFLSKFKHALPSVYSRVIVELKAMAASLCNILGAACASRNLFKALDDSLEDNDDLAHFAVGTAKNILSNAGFSNARHEAIRFSHFVSSCSTAASMEELHSKSIMASHWLTNLNGSMPDVKSVASLERSCRAAVTNQFEYQMEALASKCLFFAMFALWNVHPAAASFLAISENDSVLDDFMGLVKVGAYISYRPTRFGSAQWLALCCDSPPHSNRNDRIQLGQVVACDTVHRKWYVRDLRVDEKSNRENIVTVLHSQLAGIENRESMVSLLSWAPAPETSSEMEALDSSLAVGHLVLGLRWCVQIHMEITSGTSILGADIDMVRQLAEVLTLVLGIEFMVHGDGSVVDEQKPRDVLTAQIRELFRDEFVSQQHESVSAKSTSGSGKDLVIPPVWLVLAEQLGIGAKHQII